MCPILITHFREIIDSIEVIMVTIMIAPTPRVLASLLAGCTVHIHYFIKSPQPNDVLLVRVISEETKLWSINNQSMLGLEVCSLNLLN